MSCGSTGGDDVNGAAAIVFGAFGARGEVEVAAVTELLTGMEGGVVFVVAGGAAACSESDISGGAILASASASAA